MFVGDSCHNQDAKNRVSLPKRFQSELPLNGEGERLVMVTRGLDGCLFLFSEDGFREALGRMDTGAFTGKDQRTMQRLMLSATSRVSLDSSGRLLLTEKLRKLAELEKEVVLVGVMDRIELWAAEAWDRFESENEERFEELESVLTGASTSEPAVTEEGGAA